MNIRINNSITFCPKCQNDGLYLVDIYGGRHDIHEEAHVCISHLKCPKCKQCFKIHWANGSIPTAVLDKDLENYLRGRVN